MESRRNAVSVIDTRRPVRVATITVGNYPWNVAFHPDGSAAYVTNANADTISVIDPKRLRCRRSAPGR